MAESHDPNDGRKWDRTTDPRVISTVLFQLSYAPKNCFSLLKQKEAITWGILPNVAFRNDVEMG